MVNLRNFFSFLERRHETKRVDVERRARRDHDLSDANQKYREAIERLEATLSKHVGPKRVEVANDIQTVTVFSTFQDICRFAVNQGTYKVCRNPKHCAADTALVAECTEELCPFMRGEAMQGYAA